MQITIQNAPRQRARVGKDFKGPLNNTVRTPHSKLCLGKIVVGNIRIVKEWLVVVGEVVGKSHISMFVGTHHPLLGGWDFEIFGGFWRFLVKKPWLLIKPWLLTMVINY